MQKAEVQIGNSGLIAQLQSNLGGNIWQVFQARHGENAYAAKPSDFGEQRGTVQLLQGTTAIK